MFWELVMFRLPLYSVAQTATDVELNDEHNYNQPRNGIHAPAHTTLTPPPVVGASTQSSVRLERLARRHGAMTTDCGES